MLEVTRAVLGWCTVLNLGCLVFATAALVLFRGPVETIHGRLFGLSHEELGRAYFRYLANYKIGILLFNLAPYLALVILSECSPNSFGPPTIGVDSQPPT